MTLFVVKLRCRFWIFFIMVLQAELIDYYNQQERWNSEIYISFPWQCSSDCKSCGLSQRTHIISQFPLLDRVFCLGPAKLQLWGLGYVPLGAQAPFICWWLWDWGLCVLCWPSAGAVLGSRGWTQSLLHGCRRGSLTTRQLRAAWSVGESLLSARGRHLLKHFHLIKSDHLPSDQLKSQLTWDLHSIFKNLFISGIYVNI